MRPNQFIDRTHNPFEGTKDGLRAEGQRIRRLLNGKEPSPEIQAKLRKAREAFKSGDYMRMLVAIGELKEIK